MSFFFLSLSQCPEQSKHTCAFTSLIFRNIVETFLLQKLCFGFFSLYSSSKFLLRPFYFLSFHFSFLSSMLHYTDDQCFYFIFQFSFGSKMRKSLCASGPEVVGGQAKKDERTHISCYECYFPSIFVFKVIIIITKRKYIYIYETAEARAKRRPWLVIIMLKRSHGRRLDTETHTHMLFRSFFFSLSVSHTHTHTHIVLLFSFLHRKLLCRDCYPINY